ncbi:diacylglycerol/lipid kinase family protein [Enterococcus bulliens]
METVLIIYNDSSGNNEGQNIATSLTNYLQKEQPEWNVWTHVSNADTNPEELRAFATKHDVTRLVFIGGDGTLHHLVNTFRSQMEQYTVGIIPGGTVNNFVRSLNLPLKPQGVFPIIAHGRPKGVDYGVINDKEVIISTLTIGLLADTAARVSQKEKQTYGPLAFMKRFFRLLRKKKRYPLTIETPTKRWAGKSSLVTITMTNSAGGYVHFDESAASDDGQMHITVLKRINLWQTIRILPKVISGKLAEIQEIDYFSTDQVTITSQKNHVRTRTDGDPTDDLPVTIKVVKQGMRVLVASDQTV